MVQAEAGEGSETQRWLQRRDLLKPILHGRIWGQTARGVIFRVGFGLKRQFRQFPSMVHWPLGSGCRVLVTHPLRGLSETAGISVLTTLSPESSALEPLTVAQPEKMGRLNDLVRRMSQPQSQTQPLSILCHLPCLPFCSRHCSGHERTSSHTRGVQRH